MGADLSYSCTGLVWLEERKGGCIGAERRKYHVIHSEKIKLPPGPGRLLRAARAFHRAIKARPADLAVVEGPTFYRNKNTTVIMNELLGIMLFVLQAHGVKVVEPLPSPSQIKKYITGSGKAEKEAVAMMVTRDHGIMFDNDPGHDLYDAAACALFGVSRVS